MHAQMQTEENDVLFHIQYLSAMASVVSANYALTIPILTEPVYERLAMQYVEAILEACVGHRARA